MGQIVLIKVGQSTDFNHAVKSAGLGWAYEGWVYISAWGTGTSTSTAKRLINDEYGEFIQLGSFGSGKFGIGKYTGSTWIVAEATGLSLNTWYHYVGNVKPDYSLEIYVDKVLVGSNPNTTAPEIRTGQFYIGSKDGASTFFNGRSDQMRMHARTQETYEISNSYNKGAGC